MILVLLLLTPPVNFLYKLIAESQFLLVRRRHIIQRQRLVLEGSTNISNELWDFFRCGFQLVDSCLLYFDECLWDLHRGITAYRCKHENARVMLISDGCLLQSTRFCNFNRLGDYVRG